MPDSRANECPVSGRAELLADQCAARLSLKIDGQFFGTRPIAIADLSEVVERRATPCGERFPGFHRDGVQVVEELFHFATLSIDIVKVKRLIIYRMIKMLNNELMDIYQHRRNRLLALIDKSYGGERVRFCDKTDLSESRLAQLLSATYRNGEAFTEKTARKVEKSAGLPAMYFDQGAAPVDGKHLKLITAGTVEEGGAAVSRKRRDEVTITQYDTGGSMGAGVVLQDQPGEINGWTVTPEWLQKNVRNHSGISNLAIVTGFGDSMRGMFNPGDPILVDRGIRTFDGDAVYFFRIGEMGFIKRLQNIPGEGIIASSENKSYRDWIIKPDMDFEILARVVKVWQSVDF